MKKIIVPKFSEYTDKEWRTWFVPADIIVKITKKELTDLLMSKIGLIVKSGWLRWLNFTM